MCSQFTHPRFLSCFYTSWWNLCPSWTPEPPPPGRSPPPGPLQAWPCGSPWATEPGEGNSNSIKLGEAQTPSNCNHHLLSPKAQVVQSPLPRQPQHRQVIATYTEMAASSSEIRACWLLSRQWTSRVLKETPTYIIFTLSRGSKCLCHIRGLLRSTFPKHIGFPPTLTPTSFCLQKLFNTDLC